MSRKMTKAEVALLILIIGALVASVASLGKFIWKFTPWGKAQEVKRQQQAQEWAVYVEQLKTHWISSTNPPIVVDGNIRYIYVYTTESERLLNRYKVGETIRSPFERIAEQDKTANSSGLIVVAYWHAGRATDRDIHDLLEKNGYVRIRSNREWFELHDPLTIVPSMLAIANA